MSAMEQRVQEFAVPAGGGGTLPSKQAVPAACNPSWGDSARVGDAPLRRLSGPADVAYEEYCRRLEAGEPVDPIAFCAPYPPEVRQSLLFVILAHGMLASQVRQDRVAEPPAAHLTWPQLGENFLGFVLQSLLGQGAFARVFLATEPALGDRLVVVKVSRSGGAEAATLGRLSHPNVVEVHSVQQDPATGLTAICMPFWGAATLDNLLERIFSAGLPVRGRVILDAAQDGLAAQVPQPGQEVPAQVLERGTYVEGVCHLAAQMADALAFIHARGICHQDLKPSNVLLRPDGRPVLLDFNLSRDQRGDVRPVGGTLPYMSPEQLRAWCRDEATTAPEPDPRWDLFALGVIVYEMLAGILPFGPIPFGLPKEDLCQQMLQRQRAGPCPLREVNPVVDGSVARLVERCLAFAPLDRPASAAAVAAAFRKALTPHRRVRRWAAHHPWSMAGAVLVCLTLGLCAALLESQRDPPGVAQVRQGWAAYGRGNFKKAEEHFGLAFQDDPGLVEALFARGRARQQLGDRESLALALNDYRQACKVTPDAKIQACIGYCLSRLGDDQEAIHQNLQALAAGLDRAEVHNNLGYLYLRRAKFKEAQKSLDRAIQLDPALPSAYQNRAFLFYHKACQLFFNPAGAINPGQAQPGQRDQGPDKYLRQALADVELALKAGPGNAELYRQGGRLCALRARSDRNWVKQGVDYLKKGVDAGDDPTTLNGDRILDPFRQDDGFKALLLRPNRSRAPAPTSRLVDPLQDRVR